MNNYAIMHSLAYFDTLGPNCNSLKATAMVAGVKNGKRTERVSMKLLVILAMGFISVYGGRDGDNSSSPIDQSINHIPTALDDDIMTAQGIPVIIQVLTNDVDVEDSVDPGTVTLEVVPANGDEKTGIGRSELTDAPNQIFLNSDGLFYTVSNNNGAKSDAATVTMQIISNQATLDTSTRGLSSGLQAGSDRLILGNAKIVSVPASTRRSG